MKVLNISWRPASVGRYQASAWNTGSSVEAGFDEAPQCRKSTSQPPLFQIVQDQNGSWGLNRIISKKNLCLSSRVLHPLHPASSSTRLLAHWPQLELRKYKTCHRTNPKKEIAPKTDLEVKNGRIGLQSSRFVEDSQAQGFVVVLATQHLWIVSQLSQSMSNNIQIKSFDF